MDKKCPLLKKQCIGNDCAWFTSIRGNNPNTGEPVENEACAVAYMPVLMIENSNQQRETAATLGSARNLIAQALENASKRITHG